MQTLSSPIDLIKKSFEIFFKKENLIYFVKIYSILLPFTIFSLFQGYLFDSQTSQPTTPWSVPIVTIVSLVNGLVYILVSITGIKAVGRVVKGEKLIFKNTFAIGWKKYWKFFVLCILSFLIIGFGFILLIIPGIIFLVWFYFSTFILVEENVGVKKSLSRSKELVKGRFWNVLGRLIIFGIFGFLVGMIPFASTIFGALFVLPAYLLYQELVKE